MSMRRRSCESPFWFRTFVEPQIRSCRSLTAASFSGVRVLVWRLRRASTSSLTSKSRGVWLSWGGGVPAELITNKPSSPVPTRAPLQKPLLTVRFASLRYALPGRGSRSVHLPSIYHLTGSKTSWSREQCILFSSSSSSSSRENKHGSLSRGGIKQTFLHRAGFHLLLAWATGEFSFPQFKVSKIQIDDWRLISCASIKCFYLFNE